MSNNRISPFIKRMRTNGGTIFSFSSAVEDIGININERNNVVKISHFALLNIPSIQETSNVEVNKFNVQAIVGAWEYAQDSPSVKDGRVLIAESFQNYALNVEANLLNQDTYNATLTRTVSERVFWKWLKETGAIRWTPDTSIGLTQYWSEDTGVSVYNSVVKYIGQVSAGNVRTDTFGTYNETYVLVPTSHGQTSAYFKIVEDDNYKHGMEIGDLGERILGRETYTLPHPDGLSYLAYYDFVDSSITVGSYYMEYDNSVGVDSSGWWYTAEYPEPREPTSTDNAYLTDSSGYLSDPSLIYHTDLKYTVGVSPFEFRRSKVDCLSLVFDLDELKDIYGDPTLTYDKIAISDSINDEFDFNAVLIYYTVYNSTMDQVLGINLLGTLFLDAPSGNSSVISSTGILLPSLEKIQSGGTGFGTSYSLRLNIKTDNMMDDTQATIVDQATSDQLYAEDWTEAFANLSTAVNILTQNNSTISYLSEQYMGVKEIQTQILNDIETLQFQVGDIGRDITGTTNTIGMFDSGSNPLIDSSIYMRFGNVGIQTPDPEYPLHVVGNTKTDDIIIESAIRDTSENVLIGYGSLGYGGSLQIGASTYDRTMEFYPGAQRAMAISDSSIRIDSSIYFTRNADFARTIIASGDVSIKKGLMVTGDTSLYGKLSVSGDVSINSGLRVKGDVSIYGSANIETDLTIEGDVSINSGKLTVDGSLLFKGGVADTSIYWLSVSNTGVLSALRTW